MAKVTKGNGNAKTVEDAAKALKASQGGGKAGEETGGGTTEDQGDKPGEEKQTGTAGSEGAETGQAGEGSEGANQSGANQGGKAGEEKDPGADLEDLSEEAGEEVLPVPDDAACEKFAKQLAKNPAHLEAFRKTLTLADAMVKSQSQGPLKTAEELQAENYLRLVQKYGKDFVTAERGTNKAYYSRKAWNGMKNKQGWAEVKRTMPEAAQASQTEK